MKPIIKWTGTKRYIADQLIDLFPSSFDKYYEPFIGGGSVFARLLERNPEYASKLFLSDFCIPLIDFWTKVKTNPLLLCESYAEHWEQLQVNGKVFYNQIKDEFNKCPNGEQLLFLSRTCYNGLIRFNSNLQFNVSLHHGRPGIHPKKLTPIIYKWNALLQDTTIFHSSYSLLTPSSDDFVFLDPPYGPGTHMYFNSISFFEWLNNLPCKWMLTYDKQIPIKYTRSIPALKSNSGFRKLKASTSINDSHEIIFTNY